MNGHHHRADEKPPQNGILSKKPTESKSRPFSTSFEPPIRKYEEENGHYETPQNGYHIRTIAEVHNFNSPVSPEKPASSLRNDSLTSTEEFLLRKVALQRAKQAGDSNSEMSTSILANEAWYRDQEGRTGFKPILWKPPKNEQKSIIKKLPKKKDEQEKQSTSKPEPNFLVSNAKFKPNRESCHFPLPARSSTSGKHGYENLKQQKWISNRQASLPTRLDDDSYCHCDSPLERTPRFLYNAKTGSIHDDTEFPLGKISEDETPNELSALRRYYGHVWKKVPPSAPNVHDDGESSISSSNPESLERQSSSLSLSSKASNKSVTFAEEVEINEIETRGSHDDDDDSLSESGAGYLVDAQLEELRKPLDKQDSALDLLEKQLSILQYEARRDEHQFKPSPSPLKIEVEIDTPSSTSSPKHPRFSSSASPCVYTEKVSLPQNEACVWANNQSNDVATKNLRLQYSDDDLERKTSLGNPPPGLTLSQWEEMIRSIYLEQTSEAAKHTNFNKALNLSQKSLYPEDIYGPDVYQHILTDKESPEILPCNSTLTRLHREDTPLPSDVSLSPERNQTETQEEIDRKDFNVSLKSTSDNKSEDKANVIRSASGYFYLQKSITITEKCDVKQPVAKPTTMQLQLKSPSVDSLTLTSPTLLLAPTTNFSSCTSIEQSFYDNVQAESIALTHSTGSHQPNVKKIAIRADCVAPQQPMTVKRIIRHALSPSGPENLLNMVNRRCLLYHLNYLPKTINETNRK
uniref:Uncharacterized protein n=1 Tax=Acrobeloides nanus TaxID=290746 RepID=A0A914CIS9_9BILA